MFGATHARGGGRIAFVPSGWLPASVIEAVASASPAAREMPGNFSTATAVNLANALDMLKTLAGAASRIPLDLEYPIATGCREGSKKEIRDMARQPSTAGRGCHPETAESPNAS